MSNLKKDALRILRIALQAADPVQAVLRHVRREDETLFIDKRRYHLRRFGRIYVIGAGKASHSMALALEKLLGRRITQGLLNVKHGHVANLKRIEQNQASHPVPDIAGVEGAARIAEIAERAGADDLVICLISGGASALLPAPEPPVTLEEKQTTTRLLLECGASIGEINAVRKHISHLKGGQLARLLAPATVVSLMLSDVIGDDLDVIGSGPTAPDASTFAIATAVLEKYGIYTKVPENVRHRLEAGVRNEIPETPKPGDPVFERVQNVIVGSNALALDAAEAEARRLGWKPMVLSSFIEGETRDIALMHCAIVKEIRASGRPLKSPACVISGGETTVTMRGKGKGGRNQEFVLQAALDLAGVPDILVLSAGTDGTDGPTDAAGALADGQTLARAESAGLSGEQSLANNDSYSFFDAIGGLIRTGPTGTNVMDIRLLLVDQPQEKSRSAR